MATTPIQHHQPLLLHTARKRTNSSKTTIYIATAISLLAIIICVVALLATSVPSDPSLLRFKVCNHARNRASCLALVTPTLGLGVRRAVSMNEVELLKLFLNDSVSRIADVIRLTNTVSTRVNELRQKYALADCMDLMHSSMDRTLDSISAISSNTEQHHLDAQTWLSSVLTNTVTCSDGLNGSVPIELEHQLKDLVARASTSLAILSTIIPDPSDDMMSKPLNGKFPSWITSRDRDLLSPSPAAEPAIIADAVVAQDGSGDYWTITEAVAAAPKKSKYRYVIYVKMGTYQENVEIPKNKKNLMLIGDGMDLTIITASLNVVDGTTTFRSGTLIVGGDGFIAQDLWIQNTAGPEKHQAVALRVSADQSVINRCRLDAYQDTLYTHSHRQFYRDCIVTGTVDFIFGNAAVVLQNCILIPRKPMKGQSNMVTAQGRIDPNQNTGISIQNCEIIASSDLEAEKKSFRTYLGRPWKEYSRTVVMQSYIGDVIEPAGWSPWSGDFALQTLYYGEYMNWGAGADTSNRVKWPGYLVITSAAEASQFTVASFIQGGVWLNSTGVDYTQGL